MKRTIASMLILALLALGLIIAAGCSNSGKNGGTGDGTTPGGTTGGSGTSVTIKDFAFSPASLEVAVGASVTWTNEDSAPHTVTGDDGIDSGNLAQGKSYSHAFKTAGTYAYRCSIHPSMTGTVTVK